MNEKHKLKAYVRVNNDEWYRVCDHPYKLTFIGVTVVRQCELDDLPFKKV